MAAPAPEYIFDPSDKPALPLHDVPLIVATDESVQDYGALVEHPDDIVADLDQALNASGKPSLKAVS